MGITNTRHLGNAANDLCEKALQDAKDQLHPLLQNTELTRLRQRGDFLQAFKSALEHRIARALTAWQPGIQAVFKFDDMRDETWEMWDGSIRLLVKVPSLSDTLKNLGRELDRSLVKCFQQLDWPHFQNRQSVLEVQQVTSNEIRHGVSYGAMFYAAYTMPVKVWPRHKKRSS